MNIKKAIIQFLANEFHLDPEAVNEDTNFETDLGLKPDGVEDLLRNLQDSLNITLPEEEISNITTVSQLFEALESNEDIEA